MGDLRLLEVTKMILPRLTFYYVVLAVFMFVLAAVFPFAWVDVLLYSMMLFGFAIQMGSIGGPAGWMVSLGLYALIIVGLLVLVTLVKNRLFGYRLEPSGVKQPSSVRHWYDHGRTRMPETSSDEQGKAKN
jgi:thiol:disulfide interchange protein